MVAINISGKVAIVTGAASGLGRAEALALAEEGVNLVLTDISEMQEVIQEAKRIGVKAIAVSGDISDWSLANRLVDIAINEFGRLDIVVNNAGVTRDSMIFNLTEKQWDQVIDIHLKGHASLLRAATAHWRNQFKATGKPVDARVINTSSEAALTGSAGQPNYAAAKAGISALTVSTARAVGKYGVSVNAICPRARTSMTQDMFSPSTHTDTDPLDTSHVATLVTVLASDAAADINGRIFIVYGPMVAIVADPVVEQTFLAETGEFNSSELADRLMNAPISPVNESLLPQLQKLESLAGLDALI